MKLSHTYAQLGEAFYAHTLPTPVSQPATLLWNRPLANSLNIDHSISSDATLIAQIFSGNQLPRDANSLALAYSGHQFGHLNPQLGDGRAHLMGEVLDKNNHRKDIQLKGSGPTPWSRQGDGRCALGPAVREYIMSESLYHLGIPTTRCLAVVTSGEPVYRDTVKPGAIVTRVASSHIRVGTFEYFAIRKDLRSLTALLDYSINRHFPHIDSTDNRAVTFLQSVMEKQIELIVHWMRVGFIHGVMNTDNTTICGETIDYGPCAMMGTYHPDTVFSSIDTHGRYAFANQANIAYWNMVRLAECLLPLIHPEEEKAIAIVEPALKQFMPDFEKQYDTMLANKIGFEEPDATVNMLVETLLTLMEKNKLDFTQTFIHLQQSLETDLSTIPVAYHLGDWYKAWREQLDKLAKDTEFSTLLMKKNNPIVIPRNHHVEAVLRDCESTRSATSINRFLDVLRSPWNALPATVNYQDLPDNDDRNYQTFCGT